MPLKQSINYIFMGRYSNNEISKHGLRDAMLTRSYIYVVKSNAKSLSWKSK